MKHFLTFKRFLLLSALCFPAIAVALTIEPGNFYPDVPLSHPDAAGINMLTREGILEGYGNGTFGVSLAINRAEFLKIALMADGRIATGGDVSRSGCFPDVRSTDWFSRYVCLAKTLEIVSGKSNGRFDPAGTVTYAEALKILHQGFHCYASDRSTCLTDSQNRNEHWAQPFYSASLQSGVALPVIIALDAPLTRGIAARLVAAFLAEKNGQLAKLRLAENGRYSAYSSSSMSSSRSWSSSSSSSFSSSLALDTRSDTDIRSQFLLLGELSPIVGGATLFMEGESLDVRSVSINILSETSTVQSFSVYDDRRQMIGKASIDPLAGSNRTYTATIGSGIFTIGHREERKLYVRASVLQKGLGGQSNELVQIGNIVVKGTGIWSSQQYTKVSAASDIFPIFRTARSTITSIKNTGNATDFLVTGANRTIGSFEFTGRRTDPTAHIDVTDLRFDIQQTGGVSLANVRLFSDDFSESFPCSSTSQFITCTAIPDAYGSLTDSPRKLSIRADISTSDPAHATLRISLNDAGNASSAGSLSWSDGTNVFSWVALPSPLADGTLLRY